MSNCKLFIYKDSTLWNYYITTNMDFEWTTMFPVKSVKANSNFKVDLALGRDEFGISSFNKRRQSLQCSIHDEVYLGLGRFGRLLRWVGLLPIIEDFDKMSSNSIIDGLKYSCFSIWTIYSLVPFLAVACLFYFGLCRYVFTITDPSEQIVMACFLLFFCVTAFVNWCNCICIAPQLILFFRRLKVIDSFLGLHFDFELRSYGSFLFKLFSAIFLIIFLGIIILALLAFFLQIVGLMAFIMVLCFFTYGVACHLLPEAFFTYLCLSIGIRLRHSAHLLTTALDGENYDILYNVENLRIAYQLLIGSIEHINFMLGPILVFFCIFNIYTLCLCMYFFLQQSVSILGASPFRELLLFVSIIRIVPVCLLSSTIQEKKLSNIIYNVKSSQYSRDCNDEVMFFFITAQKLLPCVSAWDFWDVDRGFLTTVCGILLTYVITALQFSEDSNLQLDTDNYNYTNFNITPAIFI